MTYEDELAAALGTFVVEARELLQDMEAGLLGLEQDPDPEAVNAVFRAAHTIKGSSGLFGLDHIVKFTHTVEHVLEEVRAGHIPVTSELVGVLLPCRDHIDSFVEGVAKGVLTENKKQAATGAKLVEQLKGFLASTSDASPAAGAAPAQTSGAGESEPGQDAGATRALHVSLRFGQDCLRNGMDPLSFISYLGTLGEITDLVTVTAALPEAELMDAESCYLGFELSVRTEASIDAVEAVFEFVRDESDIRVLVPSGGPAPFVELAASYGAGAAQVSQFLVATTAVDASALAPVLGEAEAQALAAGYPSRPAVAASGAPGNSGGSGATASGASAAGGSPSQSSSAGTPASPEPAALIPAPRSGEPDPVRTPGELSKQLDARKSESRSIRVEAPRLDRLIDVVGELVIAGAAAGLRAGSAGDEALGEALGDVMRLVEEVRDSALQLRMVPIGTTFSRFQRVVRDVSSELGKDIQLVISGGDTEVDKALVERVSDPLMHLVRNAMDHGIESAQLREERGKPARGTLRLNAFHDSGSIVIEVQDDGGGINRDKVFAKAVERGLVDPGAVMSDSEVYALIFEPGFSTADQVSNLSGRGVGMDVVKRNVTSLRGTIDVESRAGQGSTMRIRLPLTLAIIDGFLVAVGGAAFVIPLDRVVECVELPHLNDRRECMDLRGEVLPCIRLRSLFDTGGESSRRESVVVVDYAGVKTGLVVDTLMGEYQTVIKPLGRLFEHVQGIGGATILGTGEVALIIDVPVLVRHHGARQHGQFVGAGRD